MLLSCELSSVLRDFGREMDPREGMMSGGGGGVYCSEIFPGFQMNANAASYDVDPMVGEHRSNHGPSSHNSRKRREEDECARGGASISNFYDNNNDFSARREKISERMKILQEIVPGCNKVIGKALVLDEIINYIRSLQHQVEFLSMKLEVSFKRTNF